jgi:hypothetical protein
MTTHPNRRLPSGRPPSGRRHRLAAAGLAIALGVSAPMVAGAQTEGTGPRPPRPELGSGARPDLETVRARCHAEIDRRLETLAQLGQHVDENQTVSDAHRQALTAELDAAASGLTAHHGVVDAASDAGSMRAACRAIATDYRVYLLEVPTTRLTLGGDRAMAASDRLTEAHTQLTAKVAEAAAGGADTAAMEAALADLANRVEAARGLAASTGDEVLPLTPADVTEDGPARDVLLSNRDDLQRAREELRAGAADAREVVEALRALLPAPTP